MAVIWRFKDGKAGHERQTAGLINALGKRTVCDVYNIGTDGSNPYWCWLSKTFPTSHPKPDIILGAGSACQANMLAAKRAHGGKTIYLMRPKFPVNFFDLCVIPGHDSAPTLDNVIETEGVLNDLVPSSENHKHRSIILIGGPSKHHEWNTIELLSQIDWLVKHSPEKRFLLGTSRRTPNDTVTALTAMDKLDCEIYDSRNTNWLARTLATADTVWVTLDSISMMYEALSVGANLGLLAVPVKRNDRIAKVATSLISKGYATSFSQWKKTRNLKISPVLNESARVAELVSARFPEIFG